MRKLREVLRLRYELKLGYQQIGRSCAIGVSTVHKYLKRAEAAGVRWPLPEDWDEARLESVLFPRLEPAAVEKPAARTLPDLASIHEQLRSNKYVTLQLLWEEYRQANPDGYRYSRFCYLYQRWRSKLDVVLRQEHKAGEKMFVDWAGATIPVYDRHTGEVWQASLFVAALGASSYTWAEATRDQQMESWLRSHVHACEHFHGIPALAVPDNTKTGVTKAHRYDPDLNPTYYNFAQHCGFGIVPARPYKARDKAKVESAASSVSMLLGFLTATTTVMFSVLELIRSKKLNIDPAATDGKRLEFLLPVFAALTIGGSLPLIGKMVIEVTVVEFLG